ncbi:MAG: hypothetical protein HC902_14870, partial [Calothrix sp. SM1_5_4]|nr:hypothetical protein [Calothrix sp. SM1_5_4]
MKFNRMTRRYFLRGMGSSVLALPFLESLVPKALAAVAPPNPLRRFICVCQANGTYKPDWYPLSSNDAKLVTIGNTHREMKLTDIVGPVNGAISQILGPEYAQLRSKLLLLRNLSSLFPNLRGHQMATVLAGNIGRGNPSLWGVEIDPKYLGPSIDQVMANSSVIYPQTPLIR